VKVLLAYVVAVMPNAYFDLWPGAINCFDGEGWPRLFAFAFGFDPILVIC
jgi:hypothetical protein